MNRTFLLISAFCAAIMAHAQSPEIFKPYQTTELRLPSVPLIVNDPYFSIWSPFDQLNGGTTRHWTDDEKPIDGLIRVDGKTYSFMGSTHKEILDPILPMADRGSWRGTITHTYPGQGWEQPGFTPKGWQEAEGAFGSPDLNYVRTRWNEQNSDLYVRRTFELKDDDIAQDLFLVYSHDDVFELYINGTKVADTGETWVDNVRLHLTGKLKGLLHPGRNVIAAHCHNTTGGAYTDFGLFRNIATGIGNVEQAQQTAVDVLATNTYYTFRCGPVNLDLVFTAPMLIDDLDLMSTPINYISYQVRSADKRQHDVQLLLTASPLIASNKPSQPMHSRHITHAATDYLTTGTIDQPILAKKGDGICIDWGYFYLPAINGQIALQDEKALRSHFVSTGTLIAGTQEMTSRLETEHPTLAYLHDFGRVSTAASYTLMGYDEVQDIE
nr:DUF5127 domain-containing protein [Prevotella sp.]